MWTFLFYLPFLLGFVVVAVYAERKVSAFIQSRMGPMEVGPKGLFQTVADLLKMLQKEDIRATDVDKWPFLIAPIFIFVAVFGGFALLPLTVGVAGSIVSPGLFVLLAIVSLDVIGLLMAGWASNNKYALLGALRAVAQIVSYEIPLGLSVLCVIIVSQSLDLQEITVNQGVLATKEIYLFSIADLNISVREAGGILAWNIVQYPPLILAFVVFFIAALAESNRTPFDLPEGESEIIGGYHTEYSGFRWGLFMLAEYGMMLLLAFLGSILFFGGWNTPLPNIGTFALADWTTGTVWGIVWLLSKSMFMIFLMIWIRWTFPRLRVDQLTSVSWKYLTPIALVTVMVCALWKMLML